jgi:hypothetical protein
MLDCLPTDITMIIVSYLYIPGKSYHSDQSEVSNLNLYSIIISPLLNMQRINKEINNSVYKNIKRILLCSLEYNQLCASKNSNCYINYKIRFISNKFIDAPHYISRHRCYATNVDGTRCKKLRCKSARNVFIECTFHFNRGNKKHKKHSIIASHIRLSINPAAPNPY